MVASRRALAVALIAAGPFVVGCTSDPPAEREPAATGLRLAMPRAAHHATVLADGRVLITGGCTEPGCGGFEQATRAEVYDADRGLLPAAVMDTPRASNTATLLRDGRVLIVGGYPGEGQPPTASAEVYDPERDEFDPVGPLAAPRADHTATLLPDGTVLVAGGSDADGTALATTEIFDPATDRFRPGRRLSTARARHGAVTVGDVVVLVGGTVGSAAIRSTDVLRDGTWSPGPDLLTRRVKFGAVTLGDGRVLVVGGATSAETHDRLASTELLDLDAGTSRAGPSLSSAEYKLDGAVVALPDGRILVPGGDGLELLDPEADRFEPLPGTTYDARSFRTITLVGEDTVLMAGGYDDAIVPTDDAVLVTIPAPEAATP